MLGQESKNMEIGDKVMTVNEILSLFEKAVGMKANINFISTPAGDQEKNIGDYRFGNMLLGGGKYREIEIGIFEQIRDIT
jgi:hypothetical protein